MVCLAMTTHVHLEYHKNCGEDNFGLYIYIDR